MSFLGKLFKLPERKKAFVSIATEERIKREWEEINLLMSRKGPSHLRQALIKADKCLDNALRDVVEGESMGDRLKSAKDRFSPEIYDKIWKSHKVRNNLIHEAGYEPPYYVVTEAVENLKEGLTALGITL